MRSQLTITAIFLTCHHEWAHTLNPALHGSFHQSGKAVAVSPLDVQPRVVIEQIVGDCYVTLENTGKNSSYCSSQYTVFFSISCFWNSLSHHTFITDVLVQLVQTCVFLHSSVSASVPMCVYLSSSLHVLNSTVNQHVTVPVCVTKHVFNILCPCVYVWVLPACAAVMRAVFPSLSCQFTSRYGHWDSAMTTST